MGRKAKGFRHIAKMAQKKKTKAANAAAYAAMALSGDNSKRRRSTTTKPHVRRRDNSCKNIGDLVSNPQMIDSALRLYLDGQYQGKYKGLLRDKLATPSSFTHAERRGLLG
jgi:hypothetical protein